MIGCSLRKGYRKKLAIITGGPRGIGAATAKLFAKHGGQYIQCGVAEEVGMDSGVQVAGE